MDGSSLNTLRTQKPNVATWLKESMIHLSGEDVHCYNNFIVRWGASSSSTSLRQFQIRLADQLSTYDSTFPDDEMGKKVYLLI